MIDEPGKLTAIEIKASATIAGDFQKGLLYFNNLAAGQSIESLLYYGGDQVQNRSNGIQRRISI